MSGVREDGTSRHFRDPHPLLLIYRQLFIFHNLFTMLFVFQGPAPLFIGYRLLDSVLKLFICCTMNISNKNLF